MSIKVSVFGGSSPKPGSSAYRTAYELGKALAENHYVVLTGGYIGTMEAVSKGAFEHEGEVWGITCNEIESWRPVSPNAYIHKEIRFETLRERLYALIDLCDAAIALPGGIGTLAEVSAMWSQIQVGSVQTKPLILFGNSWKDVMNHFMHKFDAYIGHRERKLLSFVSDVPTTVANLNRIYGMKNG